MTSPAPRETTPGDRRAGLMLPAILVVWIGLNPTQTLVISQVVLSLYCLSQ